MYKANAVVKVGKINHKYPTCWRSHHKIVWLARREYFYMIDKLEHKTLDAAKKSIIIMNILKIDISK